METIELEIHKGLPKITFFCLHDYPIIGDAEAIAQIKNVKQVLHCNWIGNVKKVLFVTNLEKLCIENFHPTDKGRCPVFGVDKNGDIIFGITFFTGNHFSTNPVEWRGHFNCRKADSTGEN